MAVVIQKLIDFDVLGIMFTFDPINGDQRKLLITSNHVIGKVLAFD